MRKPFRSEPTVASKIKTMREAQDQCVTQNNITVNGFTTFNFIFADGSSWHTVRKGAA